MNYTPLNAFCLALLGMAFLTAMVWSAEDDIKAAQIERELYCERVDIHRIDPRLGHRDYLGVCHVVER